MKKGKNTKFSIKLCIMLITVLLLICFTIYNFYLHNKISNNNDANTNATESTYTNDTETVNVDMDTSYIMPETDNTAVENTYMFNNDNYSTPTITGFSYESPISDSNSGNGVTTTGAMFVNDDNSVCYAMWDMTADSFSPETILYQALSSANKVYNVYYDSYRLGFYCNTDEGDSFMGYVFKNGKIYAFNLFTKGDIKNCDKEINNLWAILNTK